MNGKSLFSALLSILLTVSALDATAQAKSGGQCVGDIIAPFGVVDIQDVMHVLNNFNPTRKQYTINSNADINGEVHYYGERPERSLDEQLILYLSGSLGALMVVVFGVTSLVLAVVASIASTRRRGLIKASIICASLAVGSFVLRSLAALWYEQAGFYK
jgi:hypothetical protein